MKHETIQKLGHPIFQPIHPLSSLLYYLPCYSLEIMRTREKTVFRIYDFFTVSCYIKGSRKLHF